MQPKKDKFVRWIKRKQGKEKPVTVVSVRLFPSGRLERKKDGIVYEVEVPYGSLDDNVMSIEESYRLIVEAINKKYGINYNPKKVFLNEVSPKKEFRYE